MRALAVSPTGFVSGAETALLRLLTKLGADGWDVACACPDGRLPGALGAAGVRRLEIPDLKRPAQHGPAGAALLASRTAVAAGRLRRYASGADVIIANSLFTLPALRASSAAPPCVWLVHDVIHRRSWLHVLRATKGRVGLAIAVSDAAAAPLRRLGIDARVVHNGTQWPVEPVAPRRRGPFVVGCAGVLVPWKGQDVLLEAVAQLGREDVVLELAGGHLPGDKPYVERLAARAAEPDLDGRVRVLGHVADVGSRMRSWTVAVSASVQPEACPLAALEAMSIGVPVVGTNHGGTPECIGTAGLLVAPGDPGALSAAIGQLLDDEGLWERCHRLGPERIAGGFTVDGQVQALAELLHEAIGTCRRS